MNKLIKTAIVDKNGKATHVHKSDGITSAAGFRAPLKPVAAAEPEITMADSLDAIIAEGYDEPVVAGQTKPTDDFGFTTDGNHLITGTRFDEHGFNANGWNKEDIHRDTSEKWDSRGWKRNGLHKDTGRQTDPDGNFKNAAKPVEKKVYEGKHVSSATLCKRPGWTAAAIGKFLPDADTWGIGQFNNSANLYAEKHIEEIENSPEWAKWKASWDKRNDNAGEPVEMTIPYEASKARTYAKSKGAKWQAAKKTWLVPAGAVAHTESLIVNAEEVTPGIRDKAAKSQERAGAFEERGVNVAVTYGDTELTDTIKKVGGQWNGETKRWQILPEQKTEFAALILPIKERREAERAAETAMTQQQRDAAADEARIRAEQEKADLAAERQRRHDAGERSFGYTFAGDVYMDDNDKFEHIRVGEHFEYKDELLVLISSEPWSKRAMSDFDEEWTTYFGREVKARVATGDEAKRWELGKKGLSEAAIDAAMENDIDIDLMTSLQSGNPGTEPSRHVDDSHSYGSGHVAPMEGNSLDALSSDEFGTFPSDVYSNPHYYPEGDDKEVLSALRAARGNPEAPITIYRALPKNHSEISAGDWVTTSRAYAEGHLGANFFAESEFGEGHIISMEVPARTLRNEGNSLAEFGYTG